MAKARIGYSRQMARKLLRKCNANTPPIDIYGIAHASSVIVKEVQIADERWSGCFYKSQNTIAVNAKHHLNRRRFTVAHELGHLRLEHESIDDEFEDLVGFEGCFEAGQIGDDNELIDMEREANEFASELLIPLALIKKDFAKLPKPRELAQLYGVSETAMFVSLLKHGIFK